MIIRAPYGGGIGGGLCHSQSIEATYAHVPGAVRRRARHAIRHGWNVALRVSRERPGSVSRTQKSVPAHQRRRAVGNFLKTRTAKPIEVPAWEQPGTGELFRPTEEIFGKPTSPYPLCFQERG